MKGQVLGILLLLGVLVVMFVGIYVALSAAIVGPGEKGVLISIGKVTGDVFDEGLNWKTPILQGVDIYDTKIQKFQTDASAASEDLQIVPLTVALNYKINSNNEAIIWMRQNVGLDYVNKIIEPAVQESVKAATAKFNAEELIGERESVREEMKKTLEKKLEILTTVRTDNQGKPTLVAIEVRDFNIINFDFSPEFNAAIESKQAAEQDALRAKNVLEKERIEAQAKVVKAEAEAESIKIQSEALKENPDILQLRYIEKWNGVLPVTMLSGGNSNVLLNIPAVVPQTSTVISGGGGS
jgi:regulator of protease activity HflC (stomatin/prohibitin superfamily)